jgi:hypothetical protein
VLTIAAGIVLAVIGYYGIVFLLAVLLGPSSKPVKPHLKMRPSTLPRTGPGPLYR